VTGLKVPGDGNAGFPEGQNGRGIQKGRQSATLSDSGHGSEERVTRGLIRGGQRPLLVTVKKTASLQGPLVVPGELRPVREGGENPEDRY